MSCACRSRTARGSWRRSRSRSGVRASTSWTWRCIRPAAARPARSRCGCAAARSSRRSGSWPAWGSRWRRPHDTSVPPTGGPPRVKRFFAPSGPLRGTLRAPGDKSLSHRAALFGAMSDDPVRVTGYLDAADTRSSLNAVRACGALVEEGAPGTLTIRGPGLRNALPADIDVGNAGTLMRLIPGWLAGQGAGSWTVDGDDSIRRRPVDRVANPLREMGARIDAREQRLPPFTVHGASLRGIEYTLPVASGQVKSCVLMAGLLAEGPTTVIEPVPSRDHTERLLARSGARITRDGERITVTSQDELELGSLHVP